VSRGENSDTKKVPNDTLLRGGDVCCGRLGRARGRQLLSEEKLVHRMIETRDGLTGRAFLRNDVQHAGQRGKNNHGEWQEVDKRLFPAEYAKKGAK